MIKFYYKLAKDNILKNKSLYFPYMLCNAILIMIFYMFIALQELVAQTPILHEYDSLIPMLQMGTFVITFFLIIFELYLSNFILRKRQQDYGVINVLGFTKKKLSLLNGMELLLTSISSIIIGCLLGIVFGRLLLDVLLKLVKLKVTINFIISSKGLILTCGIFIILFSGIWIINIIRLTKMKSIELIKGDQKIEKCPKTNYLLGILGIASLSVGYYLATTVKVLDAAIFKLFIAIILVIIGTYLVFISGTTMLLNLLKHWKGFFYRRSNFISVSNLLFRIKQNAVGLANICVLSTMVVVTMTTSIMVYNAPENFNKYNFIDNSDITIDQFSTEPVNTKLVEQSILKQIKKIDNPLLKKAEIKKYQSLNSRAFKVVNVDDFNTMEEANLQLKNNEIYLYGNISKKYAKGDIFKIGKQKFVVKGQVEADKMVNKLFEKATNKKDNMVIVNKRLSTLPLENFYEVDNRVYIKLKNHTYEQEKQITSILDKQLNKEKELYSIVEGYQVAYKAQMSLVGSLLFVGGFLSIVFIINAVIIIYYKQISEGYRDRKNIQMMMKVGMEDKLVKKTIRHQIMIVFFSPLLMCLIHVIMAYPIFNLILKSLFAADNGYLFQVMSSVFIIFAFLYVVIYLLTAKRYYQIVHKKS